jgi:hypothetical protein
MGELELKNDWSGVATTVKCRAEFFRAASQADEKFVTSR